MQIKQSYVVQTSINAMPSHITIHIYYIAVKHLAYALASLSITSNNQGRFSIMAWYGIHMHIYVSSWPFIASSMATFAHINLLITFTPDGYLCGPSPFGTFTRDAQNTP